MQGLFTGARDSNCFHPTGEYCSGMVSTPPATALNVSMPLTVASPGTALSDLRGNQNSSKHIHSGCRSAVVQYSIGPEIGKCLLLGRGMNAWFEYLTDRSGALEEGTAVLPPVGSSRDTHCDTPSAPGGRDQRSTAFGNSPCDSSLAAARGRTHGHSSFEFLNDLELLNRR